MGNKMMMKLFIGSEAVFFLALILAYVYFWRSDHYTAQAQHMLHPKTAALFTALLLASSFTFYMAQRSERKSSKGMKRWLAVTVVLGAVFLAGQGREYFNLVQHEGLSFKTSLFGASFFTLTGFHSLHVLLGLILLGIILLLRIKGYLSKDTNSVLHTAGIYWHFVDVVWLVVFTLIYIVPYLL